MTKKRASYLYKFTGIIHKKYRRQDKGHPQHFYQLKVELAGSKLTKIFAFQNKTKLTIWKSLETDTYIGKKYLFSCRNYQGSYYLVDWEEVNA